MNLLANELSRRSFQVGLIPINVSVPDLILPVCDILPLGRPWPGNFYHTLIAAFRFNMTVRKWRPDILILNCDLPEFFGVLYFGSVRMIAVEHTNQPWRTREKMGRLVRRILSVRGVKWISVSNHSKIWPTNATPEAIHSNILSPIREINSSRGISSIQSPLTRLVFIGRLSVEKRPDWFLKVLAATELPGIIFGEGTLRGSLEKMASEEHLECVFAGFVKNPWDQTGTGDLLVVTSQYEGDGLVVIEALAANIPIILVDIPEFRRFGFPEKHYCSSTQELARRIDSARSNLSEFLVGAEIRSEILSERSAEIQGNNWQEYLNKILK